MQSKISALLFLCLSVVAMVAQEPNPKPAQEANPPQEAKPAQQSKPAAPPAPLPPAEKPETFVRRFSLGATLSVVGTELVPGKSTSASTTSPLPTVDNAYNTKPASQRIGYGPMVQLVLTDHIAVSASVFFRRIGYTMDTSTQINTNPVEVGFSHEDTRARLMDVPVVFRYYTKNRHDPGARVFLEAGGVLRRVYDIRTSINSTDNAGVVSYKFDPTSPAHSNVRGIVGGLGVQVIDPVGIRVVPEVRYTHWISNVFDRFSTQSLRYQIEGMLSLTF